MVQLRSAAVLVAALTVGLTAACSSTTTKSSDTGTPTATGVKKGLTVYFIPKDTQNPYEVIADEGGKAALSELGGKVVVSS